MSRSRSLLLASLLGLTPLACSAQNAPAASGNAASPSGSSPTSAESPGAPAVLQSTPGAAQKVSYSSCNVDGPYIAMTFDDGPHGTNTPRLLDMLKQRGIKATFFMVGQCVVEYPQIAKRIHDEGHEVASHSWSHPLLSKMGDASVYEELKKTHDAIVKACGVAPKTMRPPYGGFTARQQRWCNGEFGYKVILWDVDPLDWKIRNAAHVQNAILKSTRNGSIILTHDIHKSTIDAMPATLDALKERGFKFVTVSELIAMDRPAAPKPKATTKVAPAGDGQAQPPAGQQPSNPGATSPQRDATPVGGKPEPAAPGTSGSAPAAAGSVSSAAPATR